MSRSIIRRDEQWCSLLAAALLLVLAKRAHARWQKRGSAGGGLTTPFREGVNGTNLSSLTQTGPGPAAVRGDAHLVPWLGKKGVGFRPALEGAGF